MATYNLIVDTKSVSLADMVKYCAIAEHYQATINDQPNPQSKVEFVKALGTEYYARKCYEGMMLEEEQNRTPIVKPIFS